MSEQDRSILISDYTKLVAPTDTLSMEDLQTILLGLFGEVGSIMATAKKFHREKEAYAGFRAAVEEEFGDALWYLAAICRRLDLPMDDLFSAAAGNGGYQTTIAANDFLDSPISQIATPLTVVQLDPALVELGEKATKLFSILSSKEGAQELLISFADSYIRALSVTRVTFATVAHKNIRKTRGRFLEPDYSQLPTFDLNFEEAERLPEHFEISIDERKSGRSYLRWQGVFIGDPLTDNIRDPDGYRFHDVLHFAHAAILHWSPVFRALIKQKRKSCPKIDEAEDGGRAIVVEEGLTAWVFSRAKELNYFSNQKSVSFDLLKGVQQFVSGYQVADCPLKLWETAILEGYKVFVQVRENRGGIVIGDRPSRTISYKPLPGIPQ